MTQQQVDAPVHIATNRPVRSTGVFKLSQDTENLQSDEVVTVDATIIPKMDTSSLLSANLDMRAMCAPPLKTSWYSPTSSRCFGRGTRLLTDSEAFQLEPDSPSIYALFNIATLKGASVLVHHEASLAWMDQTAVKTMVLQDVIPVPAWDFDVSSPPIPHHLVLNTPERTEDTATFVSRVLHGVREEAQEEGIANPSLVAEANVREILADLSIDLSDALEVYPIDERGIAIDVSFSRGSSLILLCEDGGGILYLLLCDGEQQSVRYSTVSSELSVAVQSGLECLQRQVGS